jgi:hypothetical protein
MNIEDGSYRKVSRELYFFLAIYGVKPSTAVSRKAGNQKIIAPAGRVVAPFDRCSYLDDGLAVRDGPRAFRPAAGASGR